MITNADYNSMYPNTMKSLGGKFFTNWKRKFIFLWKYEDRWIFCKFIHVRHRRTWWSDDASNKEDYAFDDLELIRKSAIL